jgi:hypothetical protein
MKKYVIALLMIGQVSSLFAQISLADLLEGKSSAENVQPLISQAISPALTIIRQQYRLERGGEFYGRNKQPYYGETYTLGVKVPGGIILQRDVVNPWENDKNFHRIKQGDKYRPTMYRSFQRSLSDSIWEVVDLELGSQYVTPINHDSLLFHHVDAMRNFGISINDTLGKKNGYMVWVYSNTNVKDSAMHINLQQINYSLEVDYDSIYYNMNPKAADKILGGVFVVPIIERAGYIKIELVGIALKNKDEKWILQIMSRRSDSDNQVDKSTEKEKTKQDKKSEPNICDKDSEPTLIK